MNDSANPDSDAHSGSSSSSTSPVIKLLMALGILALLLFLCSPAIRFSFSTEAARRSACLMKLRQIALALQNYADAHEGVFPPAYTTDSEGKPLHSWRTLILPYLEKKKLYELIDLTKPWDDPANEAAMKTQVDVFQCPSTLSPGNYTTYLAVLGPNSWLLPGESRRRSEIAAKPSQVLMVIEVDEGHAVPWMSPVDADEKAVLGIGKEPNSRLAHSGGAFNAVFADGHAITFFESIPADLLRTMISVGPEDKVDLKPIE